jgi:hypothetical protein
MDTQQQARSGTIGKVNMEDKLEVQDISCIIRAQMDPEAESQLGDTVFLDELLKIFIRVYIQERTAKVLFNLVKWKWNYLVGRFSRYWHPDQPGGICSSPPANSLFHQ